MAGESRKKGVRWAGIAIVEALILLFSYVYTGRRHRYSEPNSIARLFLDEPGFVESLLFYVFLFHILIVIVFLAAMVATRRKRRRGERRVDGRRSMHNASAEEAE